MICTLLWVVLLDMITKVQDTAVALKAEEPAVGSASDKFPVLAADMHTQLAAISNYLTTLRLVYCWYTILISFKFLESFEAQPRLAMVTNTIRGSFADLIHFLVV